MKKFTFLFLFLLISASLFSQNISNCNLDGNDDRWESQWGLPGTTEVINAMIEGPDGNIWATGNYTGSWGGEPKINGLASWDDERWTQIGGDFRCTSCGLGYRDALKMNSNGDVFVGGSFEGAENSDGILVESSGIIKWNTANQIWEAIGGVYDLSGNRGRVRAIEIDTTANILYIGGSFELVVSVAGDTTYTSNVAALDMTTMTWSNMNGGVHEYESYLNGVVYSMAMGTNSTLYVGGSFSEVEEQTVYSLAQWHPTSGWASVGTGLPDKNLTTGDWNFATAYSLLYDFTNDILYAGGTFGEFSGSSTTIVNRSLAYFQNGTWTLISGIGQPYNTGSSRVNALVINPISGHLFVGGNFTQHLGTNSPVANLVGEWNPATATWNNLNQGLKSGSVNSMVFKNNQLYVGGNFTQFSNDEYCNKFVMWNGTSWDNLGNGLNDLFAEVRDISFTSDGFIVAGNFDKIDQIDATRIARWRVSTGWENIPLGIYETATSNYNKLIYSMLRDGDWLYVGGFFGGVDNNILTNGIAAYNLATGQFKTWGTGIGGSFPKINDITLFKGKVYIAGRFTGIDGNSMSQIARLNPISDTWEAIGSPDNEVQKLTNVKDSVLVVTGAFLSVDGNTDMRKVATFDGNSWAAMGKGIFNGTAYDAVYVESDDAILVSGSFTKTIQADGAYTNMRMLAGFKNGEWESFDTITSSNNFQEARRMYYDDETGLVYLAGRFTEVDGQPINRIVRFDPITKKIGHLGSGLDYLDTNISSSSTTGRVNFIGKQNGKLVLGGSFSSAGINQASSIARYQLEDYAFGIANIALSLPDSLESCSSVFLATNSEGVNFLWSTNETTSSIEAAETGSYAVTVTSPMGCQNSDTTFVTILPPAEISFEGISMDSIVACDSVVLTPVGDFVEYYWNNGTYFNNTFTATSTGWVIFEGQDSNGCFGKDSVYVFVPSENITPTLPSTISGCESAILDAGTDDYFYEWSNGATTPTIEITESGTYTVTVTSLGGCSESATTVATISQNPAINFAGIDEGSIVVCDSVELFLEGNYVEYYWNNGMFFDPTLTVYETEEVTVLVQDGNGCIGMDTLLVTVEQSPTVDFTYEIVEDSVYFFVINPTSGLTYVWDFGNGQTGSGSTPYHVYAENGTYQVQVTASSITCGNAVAASEISIDQVNAQQDIYNLENFVIQPNPTTDFVLVKWETQVRELIDIELFDLNGKVVLSKKYETKKVNKVQLNVAGFPAGIYLGRLRNGDSAYSFKVVKR